MNSEFLPEAEKDFREATMYYETKAPGVGVAFVIDKDWNVLRENSS